MTSKLRYAFHVPFPPSANEYWRIAKGRMYVTEKAKTYRESVSVLPLLATWNAGRVQPLDGPVGLEIEVFMPDGRRRDLDNCLKILIDALTDCGFWHDDSQIVYLEAIVNPNLDQHGGKVNVRVIELEPGTQWIR